ncbi:MAG: CopG family antitoxin [Phycisphaerales bacterium]
MKSDEKRKRRGSRKSGVSKGKSYAEMGDFWDQHDLSDFWDKTRSVRADVQLESEESFYAIEKGLSQTIREEAKERGISPRTLVNLWLQEKLQEVRHQ